MSRYLPIILCTATAALVALGLIMLTSTGAWVSNVENPYHFLTRQAAFAALGLIGAYAASRLSPELLRKLAPILFLVACIMLALCYVPGVSESRLGARRWIHLPLLGTVQPSEMARIVIVIALAAWFARWQTEITTFWRGFVLPGAMVAIPVLLIACEKDVGTALSCSLTIGIIFFTLGVRLRYLLPTALAGIAGAAAFIYSDPVRRTRIEVWQHLEKHTLDEGMQQWRALLALGNGGPSGVGLGNSVEKFGTLSYAHIDFIYPVIGEELGLAATLGVIFCFVLIAVAGCGISMQAKTVFNRILALGLTCMIVLPGMVHIAVTTATIPNDGLPLPFVSFGGTSLVCSLAAIGLLCGIHRRSVAATAPEEFPLARQTRLAVRL